MPLECPTVKSVRFSVCAREKEILSSYIRLTAHHENDIDAEDEGISLLGTTMTKSFHLNDVSTLDDHIHHHRVLGGNSNDNGDNSRTHGRLEASEAHNGRVLDFRLRDYIVDFLL